MKLFARTATGAALAITLGCGLVPAVAVPAFSPVQAWAETANTTVPAANGIWNFNTDGQANKNTGSDTNLNLALTSANGEASDVKSLGRSLHFANKVTDHNAQIANAITPRNDFTISLWLKADTGVENGAKTAVLQMGGNGRTLLYQRQDGAYVSFIGGADIVFDTNPGRGTWHHVTLVKQSTAKTVTLYINGERAGSGTWTETLCEGNVPLILGEHKNANDMDRFQGYMDEVCLWSSALTAEQVKAKYDSYTEVNKELESVNAKQKLSSLIEKAKSLQAQDDGADAYKALADAIIEAETALENESLETIKSATKKLEESIGAVYALGLTVNVDPNTITKTIDDGIFGINHRYAFNGYGSFDSKTMKVKEEFAKLYDESDFGSIRYPGGTISNLFNWKETLGDKEDRTPQIHGFFNNSGQGGIAPNFGISEIGTFAQEHDSEIIYVYALGRGDANDAADLVEFLNAEVGQNPNGGTDWAKVRADQGHPQPYNVRYFEIGNEMNQGGTEGQSSQQYWTAHVLTDPNNTQSAKKAAVDAYIDGGTASFVKEYAIRRGDWNAAKSYSDGTANQEFGMRYALVPRDSQAADYDTWTAIIPESAHVYVNDVEWTKTDDLKKHDSDDKVFKLDEKTGYFTFGDGTNGAIPTKDHQVKVTYKVERDGFVEISQSMRETMEEINEHRKANGITEGELHIYSSFEDASFFNKMHTGDHDALYDGMAIHPYSFGPGDGLSNQDFYMSAMNLGNNAINRVKHLTEEMRSISGDNTKVPVISEYGIFRSTNSMVRSQTHALYIARQIMAYIELGSPYIQKHCLVDWYSNGADSLGPTQQAVIQAVPVNHGEGNPNNGNTKTGEGDFTFFKTPSALVFQMFNGMFGNDILNTSLTEMEPLNNGVKPYDVIASKDAAGNFYVAITHLDLEKDGSFTLKLKDTDLTGRELQIQTIVGDSFDTENSPTEPNKVQIETSSKTAETASPTIELKPHSFTIVKVVAPKDTVTPPTPPVDDNTKTETDAQGNTITTKTHADGSKTVAIETKEDTAVTAKVNKEGKATSVSAKVSESDIKDGVAHLPLASLDLVAKSAKDACQIKVDLPAGVDKDNKVVLNVAVAKDEDAKTVAPGAVFVRVNADGSRTILPKTAFGENSIFIELDDDAILEVVDASKGFGDVENTDWFASEVAPFASARGIINGVNMPNDTREFQGNGTTSRGMFIAMLHNLELNPKSQGDGGFNDIADDSWFKDAAAWGSQTGIVEGYGDGSVFGGDDAVTREQMAVFMMRYANSLGMDVSKRADIAFPDAGELSDFAKDSMSWAVAEGLFFGNDVTGELNPTDHATRAEVAAVLMRFINNMYK